MCELHLRDELTNTLQINWVTIITLSVKSTEQKINIILDSSVFSNTTHEKRNNTQEKERINSVYFSGAINTGASLRFIQHICKRSHAHSMDAHNMKRIQTKLQIKKIGKGPLGILHTQPGICCFKPKKLLPLHISKSKMKDIGVESIGCWCFSSAVRKTYSQI